MARLASKRWRLPDTEIDFVLVENGPHAGEFLVSAETVDRLPEYYARVKDLPYRPVPPRNCTKRIARSVLAVLPRSTMPT